MSRFYLLPAVGVLLTAIVLGVGWWGQAGKVEEGPDPVSALGEITALREEIVYTCGDREIRYQGPVPPEMQGLNVTEIQARFPDEDGWSVAYNFPDELVITRESEEFCPKHASYRHLGIHGEYVAIYEGPLGGGGELLETQHLRVDRLPEFYRQNLLKAMAFAEQPPEVQEILRKELEFPDEDVLLAALENLDEL